jgi:hypothetical protein
MARVMKGVVNGDDERTVQEFICTDAVDWDDMDPSYLLYILERMHNEDV